MGESDTLLNAGIGAVVTIVTSFLPFSPVLGGAVAGYLQGGTRTEGAKVGGISGAISLLPMLFFGFIVMLFLFGAAPAEGGIAFAFLLLVAGTAAVAYTVGLSALGGYVGVYVLEETDVGRDADRGGSPRGPDGVPGRTRSEDERWGQPDRDEPARRDESTEQDETGWDDREASRDRDDDSTFGGNRRDDEY